MIEDFIRIRGDLLDPAPFQGIGSTSLSSGGGGVSVGGTSIEGINSTVSIEIKPENVPSDVYWAQSKALRVQADYAQAVKNSMRSKANSLPQQEGLIQFLLEAYRDHVDEALRGDTVSYVYNPIASAVGDFLVVVAAESLEFLREFYDSASQTCDAIMQTNQALGSDAEEPDDEEELTYSATEYDRREAVLSRQAQQLADILAGSDLKESSISRPGETWNGTWGQWIQDIEDTLQKMEDWTEDTEQRFEEYVSTNPAEGEGDDATEQVPFEVPAPIDPGLPQVPPSTHPVIIFLYYLLKYGRIAWKIWEIIEKIRKKNETLDTAKLLQAIQDLKFNDMEFNLPNSSAKFNLFSNAVRYGGATAGNH